MDTPCCILTQEESKRLIHGTAKEKYQFFLKATGLQSVHDDLARAEQDVEEATAMKEQELPRLETRKADFKAALQCVEEFKQLDGIDDKIRYQHALLLWDEVRSEEAVVEGVQAKAAEFESEVESAQAELDADSGQTLNAKDIDEQMQELGRLQALVDVRAAEAGTKQAEFVQLQKLRDSAASAIRNQVRGINEHEAQIKANDREVSTFVSCYST